MTVAVAPGPRWLGAAGQVALAGALALVLLPVGWTSVVDGEVSTAWEIALMADSATIRRWSVGSTLLSQIPFLPPGAKPVNPFRFFTS